MPEIIQIKLISRHHNNVLADHFKFNKTKKLVGRKYYWLSIQKDVEVYVKGCNICLASKVVKHKLYGDFQALPVPTH